jgi:hypothetical protein
MIKAIFIIFLSIVNGFASDDASDKISDLRQQKPLSVFKRDNLTNSDVEAIGCGKVWKLRASRNDEDDRQTMDAFIKVVAHHAYNAKDPLNFSVFEDQWNSQIDTAYQIHYGCILGLTLSGHLLQNFVSYNENDSRIMSQLKERYGNRFLLKMLELSYDSLSDFEKEKKETTFDKLKGMIVEKKLTQEECFAKLDLVDKNSPHPPLNTMPIHTLRAYVSVYGKRGTPHSSIVGIIDGMLPNDALHSLRALAFILQDEIKVEDVKKSWPEYEKNRLMERYPEIFVEGTVTYKNFEEHLKYEVAKMAIDINKVIIQLMTRFSDKAKGIMEILDWMLEFPVLYQPMPDELCREIHLRSSRSSHQQTPPPRNHALLLLENYK